MPKWTLDDLMKEFKRLAEMPDDTFFTDGDKIYFNAIARPGVGDEYFESTADEDEKYNHLMDDIVGDAERMANELLISDTGGCNWDNIKRLRSFGYKVYATDKDSFGWLCAAVEKDNHVLSYG